MDSKQLLVEEVNMVLSEVKKFSSSQEMITSIQNVLKKNAGKEIAKEMRVSVDKIEEQVRILSQVRDVVEEEFDKLQNLTSCINEAKEDFEDGITCFKSAIDRINEDL